MKADRWYSKNGGPAHAVWIGWDGPERHDYYYTRCGLNVGYSRPGAQDGWAALGHAPDPGIERCARCEKAVARAATQAERDAVAWSKFAVRLKRAKKKVRDRYRETKAKKREKMIREIQELLAPTRMSKKVIMKIVAVVRRAVEEETADAKAAKAEEYKAWEKA